MRFPLLCALNYAVLAGGVTTTASDLTRPLGDPQLERPTLRSLGVYWIIVALGFSAQIRARSDKDLVHIVASTNGGTTWRAVADTKGSTQGRTGHFRVADWPRGTRKVLLRFEMTGNSTVGAELPGRCRLPRPARRDDDSPLPRRPPLDRAWPGEDPHQTDHEASREVRDHDP